MVRLKLVSNEIVDNFQFRLNSTMVRLKHSWFNNKHSFEGNLNSTMVRLKLIRINIHHHSCLVKSQFHYGSIKTIRLNEKREYDSTISIPLWFD